MTYYLLNQFLKKKRIKEDKSVSLIGGFNLREELCNDRIWADKAINILIRYIEHIKRGVESSLGTDNQFDKGYIDALEMLIHNLKEEIQNE